MQSMTLNKNIGLLILLLRNLDDVMRGISWHIIIQITI